MLWKMVVIIVGIQGIGYAITRRNIIKSTERTLTNIKQSREQTMKHISSKLGEEFREELRGDSNAIIEAIKKDGEKVRASIRKLG